MDEQNEIRTHETIQKVGYVDFMRKAWSDSLAAGRIPAEQVFPDPEAQTVDTLAARIVWNRWLVDCPTCRSATICSGVHLRFICPDCGSPENSYQWYAIEYPKNWSAIEAELKKRPAPLAGNYAANTRNWSPEETIEELEAETKKAGNLRKVERAAVKKGKS